MSCKNINSELHIFPISCQSWIFRYPSAKNPPMVLSPQVPYETLNKRFRAAQKNIDRETSHVTMVVAELEKTLSNFPVVDSVVSLLDGVVEKLSALKRKVRDTDMDTNGN
uniref:Uncharacterized protein n=1 Tax=Cynoglossus semilaevis TaxID=244447 RepID=A0A3P8VCX9_CYNSE